MDVHPIKNGINRYWSIPISLNLASPLVIKLGWKLSTIYFDDFPSNLLMLPDFSAHQTSRFPPISPRFPRPSRPAPPIGDKRPRCRSVCRSIPTWFFDAQRGARSGDHPKLVETLQGTGKIWSQNATGLWLFFDLVSAATLGFQPIN